MGNRVNNNSQIADIHETMRENKTLDHDAASSGTAPHPNTRRHRIGKREIVVLDDLFRPESILQIHTFVAQLPYRLNEEDSPDSPYPGHRKSELPLAVAAETPVFKQCMGLAGEVAAPEPLRLFRIHSNLHFYGDRQLPHFDRVDGVTVLYHANSEWNEKWMGETIFYDENRVPVYTVAPRPGRVVVFHGGILHRGGVPSPECIRGRITVALKFEPER
jgi:SM-20-related protein